MLFKTEKPNEPDRSIKSSDLWEPKIDFVLDDKTLAILNFGKGSTRGLPKFIERFDQHTGKLTFAFEINEFDENVIGAELLEIDNDDINQVIDVITAIPNTRAKMRSPNFSPIDVTKEQLQSLGGSYIGNKFFKLRLPPGMVIGNYSVMDKSVPMFIINILPDAVESLELIYRPTDMRYSGIRNNNPSVQPYKADASFTVINNIEEAAVSVCSGPFGHELKTDETGRPLIYRYRDDDQRSMVSGRQDHLSFFFSSTTNIFEDLFSGSEEYGVPTMYRIDIHKDVLEPGIHFLPQLGITFAYDVKRVGKNGALTKYGELLLRSRRPMSIKDLMIKLIDTGTLKFNRSQFGLHAVHHDPKIIGKTIYAMVNGICMSAIVGICAEGDESLYFTTGKLEDLAPMVIKFDPKIMEDPEMKGLKLHQEVVIGVSMNKKTLQQVFDTKSPTTVNVAKINDKIQELSDKLRKTKKENLKQKNTIDTLRKKLESKKTEHEEKIQKIKKDTAEVKYQTDEKIAVWKAATAAIGLCVAGIALGKALASNTKKFGGVHCMGVTSVIFGATPALAASIAAAPATSTLVAGAAIGIGAYVAYKTTKAVTTVGKKVVGKIKKTFNSVVSFCKGLFT